MRPEREILVPTSIMDETGQTHLPWAVTLSERIERYKVEIEDIVRLGIEHERYELKRSVTITKQNLADRLDFVKLVQGLANAHLVEERFIIIGADQGTKGFVNVSNGQDFDPATVHQILEKYLYPMPMIEVFKYITSRHRRNLHTDCFRAGAAASDHRSH